MTGYKVLSPDRTTNGEQMIYSSPLTPTQEQALKEYLHSKWGIDALVEPMTQQEIDGLVAFGEAMAMAKELGWLDD